MLGKSLEQLEKVLSNKEARLKEAREAIGTVKSSTTTINILSLQESQLLDKLSTIVKDRIVMENMVNDARKRAEKLLK